MFLFLDDTQNDKSYEPSDLLESKENCEEAKEKDIFLDDILKNIDQSEVPCYQSMLVNTVVKNEYGKKVKKPHLCPYCLKDQKNLTEHVKRRHPTQPDVIKMVADMKKNPGSKEPSKKLIFVADIMYNTDKKLNKGNLRVCRAPQSTKTANDFTNCPKYNMTLSAAEFRFHATSCMKISGKFCRNLVQLGKDYIKKCSPLACEALKIKVLFRMRNDTITRGLKYDDLIIVYGNELVYHLRKDHHRGNISNQLRRLERLKIAYGVKKFCDAIHPSDSVKMVEAIEKLARGSSDKNFTDDLTYPTLAQNLRTLVVAVCESFKNSLVKEDKLTMSVRVQNYIDCFSRDFRTRLSRLCQESHSSQRRHKDTSLPSQEDICKLYNYLKNKRMELCKSLKNTFSEKTYLELQKVTLCSLQVYNRRRPGDVERILLEDYTTMKQLNTEDTKNFHLSPGLIDLSREFSLLYTRGKLNRDIKLLVTPDVRVCIDVLLESRHMMNISPRNKYLFGLPVTPIYDTRHPSAYVILNRIVKSLDLENNSLITATKLRKHLATSCIKLNLSDNELIDLASFMGHNVNVHKSVYRKNQVQSEIPKFLTFISAAMGDKVENSSFISSFENNSIDYQNSHLGHDENLIAGENVYIFFIIKKL